MEYRQLPHGNEREKFGVLGLGMGGIQHTPPQEIEAIIRKAIASGINFFDLCAGGAVYAPFGRAIRGQRDKVFLQVHFPPRQTPACSAATAKAAAPLTFHKCRGCRKSTNILQLVVKRGKIDVYKWIPGFEFFCPENGLYAPAGAGQLQRGGYACGHFQSPRREECKAGAPRTLPASIPCRKRFV